ncbi:hypothetical protein CHH28_18210 [Bacterioplanes sanyensis]|uniref:VacJ n=1 Tax=Bacterioplanes sanyensis TaxID=1249553 RepID=A0A222FPP2_9GAMM|nr:hypothetical protein [Bacterioplanes sanyensis]ASP40484.1 hypothetical protein CHH28_18210 [Bacterioplanes sanyensis]
MLINRAAIILKAKQPAVDWINSVEPDKRAGSITLEDVNLESIIYLVPEDIENIVYARAWVMNNAEILLEEFLDSWYQDDSLWPSSFSDELFEQWFSIEYHSMIIDTTEDPIDKEAM